MTDHRARHQVELDVNVGREASTPIPRHDGPFAIALIGDFRGRGERAGAGPADLSDRRPILVDRDNFDDVLARMAPELWLDFGDADGASIAMRFTDLDDFHPDRMFERLPVFRSLRVLRDRLVDPRTFADAALELRRWAHPAGGVDAGRESTANDVSPTTERTSAAPTPVPANLLDRMLEESAGAAPARPAPPDEFQSLVRSIVAPHVIPDRDPRQPELVERVDGMIADQMRAILHHPDFQALEAAWRAVFFLIRIMDTDAQLKLYLVDIARTELEADLAPGHELAATGLHRLLVDRAGGTLGATPWSLAVGLFTFDDEPRDIELLVRIAAIAGRAGAPWIAAGHPRLVGFPSFETVPDPADAAPVTSPEWAAFRRSAGARFVGLAAPRFLLRLPYGQDTDPCDTFRFEEMGSPPVHDEYLWGNPAVVCTELIARAYSAAAWEMWPGMFLDLDGLPVHLVRMQGETVAKPCAETLMSERAAAHIMDAGLMPLATMKDSDAVRLVRFQSVAAPLAALAGPWRGRPAG